MFEPSNVEALLKKLRFNTISFDEISGTEFKYLVLHMFESLGFKSTQPEQLKDLGFDIVVTRNDPVFETARLISPLTLGACSIEADSRFPLH